MQTVRAVLLCAMLSAGAVAPSWGDEVDDLLSGVSPALPAAAPSLEDRIVGPEEARPLLDDDPWEISLGGPEASVSQPTRTRVKHRREPAPTSGVSLVPEPTAIALAAGALLYFLIFFRRRHLA